jgi:putative cardiolipin synthase
VPLLLGNLRSSGWAYRLNNARRCTALALCALLAGCAANPPGASAPKRVSNALDPATETPLSRTFHAAALAADGKSGLRMLSVGLDGLLVRTQLIDATTRTLDLQYYIFRADESGNLIAAALMRAADRGVRVRILIDDGETVPGDERILSLAAHPGVEVRIFNPLRYRGHNRVLRGMEFLTEKQRLDYRMHNKLLVADNTVALIGGRNIGDQYFQIDPDSQFGDDDLVVVGPMVARLSGVYDQFWNGPLAIPAEAVDQKHASTQALAQYRDVLAARQKLPSDTRAAFLQRAASGEPLAGILAGRAALMWVPMELVFDSPDKKDVDAGLAFGHLIYAPVAKQIDSVNSELLMVTPYFVPSNSELGILEQARARQVRVSLLTNSLAAAPVLAAQSGYMHYRVRLLEHGVELHELRARLGNTQGSGQGKAISRHGNYALHSKLYVFDRKKVYVGSMNFDERSKHLNTEIGLIVNSEELAQQVVRRFDELTSLDNAYTVVLGANSTAGHPHLEWKTREAGQPVSYTVEPARSRSQKFEVEFLSLLPLDHEL